MSDYNRIQAFSSIAAIPASFVVLGISLLAFGAYIWWIVGVMVTIVAMGALILLAISYRAGTRASQTARIHLADGTLATFKRRVTNSWIIVIVVIVLLIALIPIYLWSDKPPTLPTQEELTRRGYGRSSPWYERVSSDKAVFAISPSPEI